MPLSTGTIKFISSLRQRKFRQKYHKFTAEGGRIVGELLEQNRYRVDHLYATADWVAGLPAPPAVPLTEVTARELGRLSQLSTPNQVLAVVDLPDAEDRLPSALGRGWSLFLDGVQSPSNLGAILRIADWFAVPYVVCGPGTADPYAAKSVQATMGSFLRTDVRRGDLGDLTAAFPDLTVFGADLAGENVYAAATPDRGVLVVGAEGPGVSEGARARVQRWLTIPRGRGSRAESLNVAVATGILCGKLLAGEE